MIILPADKERALKLLAAVAAQRVHCTAIVRGDTEMAREAASRADVRAENHPFRKVVWMPDPKLIEHRPEYAEIARTHATSVFLSFSFHVVRELHVPEALSFIAIERAFIDASMATP